MKPSLPLLEKIYAAPPRLEHRTEAFRPVLEQLLGEGTGPLQVLEWGTGVGTADWLQSTRVQRLVSCTTDRTCHEAAGCRFASEIGSGRLELQLWPCDGKGTGSLSHYDPCHDFVVQPLRKNGEDSFDVVFVNTPLFGADCVELARLLVRDGGIMLWADAVSWADGDSDRPSGRRRADVAGHFSERYYFDAHRTLLLVNQKTPVLNRDAPLAKKRAALEQMFQRLDEAHLDFVLLRNADTIPAACTVEADIDVLIPPDAFGEARGLLVEAGFTHQADRAEGAQLYQAQPHHHFYLRPLDLHIDVVTGLYYTSLNRRDRVGIHRHLQTAVLERRRRTDDLWRYTPSVNDGLLHLLCHCLYDKQAVPPKYEALIHDMFAAADRRTLDRELEGLFFRFAPRIEACVQAGRTRDLHQHYLRFMDY